MKKRHAKLPAGKLHKEMPIKNKNIKKTERQTDRQRERMRGERG